MLKALSVKRGTILGVTFALLTFALTACGANPEESAVRAVVSDTERVWEDAIDGKLAVAALNPYFATPEEGANAQGLINTRDAFQKMVNDHVSGVSLVQLSNFRITEVQIHQSGGLARVKYQMDIRIVHGTEQGTATLTQDLALLKTAGRGWRISGGDTAQVSNVVGKLPR